jgi:hypothetical protein
MANILLFRHSKQFGAAYNKEMAEAELKKVKSLETTYVQVGFFMDFWGLPGVKTYCDPLCMFVDIPNEVAAIPGDGNMPIVMTHTTDVAKLAAASLDLEKWDPVMYTVGDRVSMNELLHFAEDAKGKISPPHSLEHRRANIIHRQKVLSYVR